LDGFVASLTAYVSDSGERAQLKSAALAVWNCADPLPATCGELVVALTGDRAAPKRFSQAARRILKAL